MNTREYIVSTDPLPATFRPMDLMTGLAAAKVFEDYVVFEGERREWCYAGGAEAEVRLTANRITFSRRGTVEIDRPWTGDPLREMQSLIEDVGVPAWRAYGWAAFELSYLLAGDHVEGDETLAYLVVPKVDIRVLDGHLSVRALDEIDLRRVNRAILEASRYVSDAVPTETDVRASGGAEYKEAVTNAVEDINDGRLAKVILSRVLPIEPDFDMVASYRAGRAGNNPARSFLLDLPGIEAMGFSPEIVVNVTPDGKVTSQPLAGTRALTGNAVVDSDLRAELVACPKEVYEHAISVKVGTDELIDACEPDSIEVPDFMAVLPRGSVQHLASRVTGRLRDGKNHWDAFRAVFPAVTASGVPKKAAYETIRRYEHGSRGLYSGTVMTLDSDGRLDAALVLRSAYRRDGKAWLRAGAGIVGQSTPEREYEETCEKLESVARFIVPIPERAAAA
ncbi:salicylate synthase [Myceligenerans cantabricum]